MEGGLGTAVVDTGVEVGIEVEEEEEVGDFSTVRGFFSVWGFAGEGVASSERLSCGWKYGKEQKKPFVFFPSFLCFLFKNNGRERVSGGQTPRGGLDRFM